MLARLCLLMAVVLAALLLAGGPAAASLVGNVATGETPPHSRMTWLIALAPGREVVLAGPAGRLRIVALVDVRGAR